MCAVLGAVSNSASKTYLEDLLEHCRHQSLQLMLECRWEEDTEGVHTDLRQKSLDWLSECFEAAHQSARQAIDYMCNFIGMKVCALPSPPLLFKAWPCQHLLASSCPPVISVMYLHYDELMY